MKLIQIIKFDSEWEQTTQCNYSFYNHNYIHMFMLDYMNPRLLQIMTKHFLDVPAFIILLLGWKWEWRYFLFVNHSIKQLTLLVKYHKHIWESYIKLVFADKLFRPQFFTKHYKSAISSLLFYAVFYLLINDRPEYLTDE